MKKRPHKYQKATANFCAKQANTVLSVEMGLGKTASVLYFLKWLKPTSALIVAPKRVAETVWRQETTDNWEPTLSDLTYKMQIVSGSKKKRYEQLLNSIPYKIIGRDNLNDLVELNLMEFDVLIIDELTSFKTPTSKRTQIILQIKALRKIGLTGTLIANGAIDIFSQMAVLDIEHMSVRQSRSFKWSPEFREWRARNFRDVLKGAPVNFEKWVLITPFENLIKPYQKHIFTLKSEDYLEIPPVTYHKHDIELSKDEMIQYRNLETNLMAELGDDWVVIDEGARFAKLQTLCNGFIYLPEGGVARGKKSSKLEAVANFVLSAVAENEQVLLLYAFIEEEVWLRELLKGISVGGKNDLDKWNNREIDVLIAHPASIGHGLNLHKSGARLTVWSSITPNFEYWAQANARLARQGQKRNVQIHTFATVDTCESRKYQAIRSKENENNKFLDLTK